MIVTRSYLLLHRTESSGWTKAQFDVLGLSWPPCKGWMQMVKGKDLTDEECQRFEDAKFSGNNTVLSHIKFLLRKCSPEQIIHLREWLKRL